MLAESKRRVQEDEERWNNAVNSDLTPSQERLGYHFWYKKGISHLVTLEEGDKFHPRREEIGKEKGEGEEVKGKEAPSQASPSPFLLPCSFFFPAEEADARQSSLLLSSLVRSRQNQFRFGLRARDSNSSKGPEKMGKTGREEEGR